MLLLLFFSFFLLPQDRFSHSPRLNSIADKRVITFTIYCQSFYHLKDKSHFDKSHGISPIPNGRTDLEDANSWM